MLILVNFGKLYGTKNVLILTFLYPRPISQRNCKHLGNFILKKVSMVAMAGPTMQLPISMIAIGLLRASTMFSNLEELRSLLLEIVFYKAFQYLQISTSVKLPSLLGWN